MVIIVGGDDHSYEKDHASVGLHLDYFCVILLAELCLWLLKSLPSCDAGPSLWQKMLYTRIHQQLWYHNYTHFFYIAWFSSGNLQQIAFFSFLFSTLPENPCGFRFEVTRGFDTTSFHSFKDIRANRACPVLFYNILLMLRGLSPLSIGNIPPQAEFEKRKKCHMPLCFHKNQ